MRANILKITLVLFLISLPRNSQAGVITVADVSVEVQPVDAATFKLFLKFNLPKLPARVNIDYAVLSFGVDIATPPDGKLLEILSADSTSQGKSADYNANPVTGLIPGNKAGLTQIDLDITELVDLWVNGGEKNQGAVLVSHRKIPEKALETGKVVLAPEFKKATATIYYTVVK